VRQLVTPDQLQGRVNATARMIAWGGSPFGALVGGLLADQIGIRPTFLLMAGLMLLIALLGWFTPLRERTMLNDGMTVEA
jgi:MFS family permease